MLGKVYVLFYVTMVFIYLSAVNTNVPSAFQTKTYKLFLRIVSILKVSTFRTLRYVVETALPVFSPLYNIET